VNNEEIIRFWGKDVLARWSERAASKIRVAADDQRFLVDVGFPQGIDWTLSFPPSEEEPQRQTGRPVLGFDTRMPICVDEEQGRVGVLDGMAGGRFMNSSIRKLGSFLVLYQTYRTKVREMDEDSALALVEETAARFEAEDVQAMAAVDNYWPVIVEQMRDGLL
jgi:hypothetical protein